MEKIINEIISDPSFIRGVAWERRPFSTNEVVITEGDVGKTLFFIESGRLRVSVLVDMEERRNVNSGVGDLSKGDLFGDTCLLRSCVRTASVTALTDGCLLEISGEKLSMYLETYPTIGYQFYKSLFNILFERLSKGNRRIEYLLAWGVKARGLPQQYRLL